MWQANREFSQKYVVLAIGHVQHTSQIACRGDALALISDLHGAFVRVIEVEIRLPQTDCGAYFDQSIRPGFSFPVVKHREIAFANAVQDDLKDRTIGAFRVRVPRLNPIRFEDDGEVVPKVGRNGVVETMSDKGFQAACDANLPVDGKDALECRAADRTELNKTEAVAGKLRGVAGQDAFRKGVIEARGLNSLELPFFETFVLVKKVASRFDLRRDRGDLSHGLGSRQSHQSPCLGAGIALFDQVVFEIRFPRRGGLAETDRDEGSLPGGAIASGTTLGRQALFGAALLRCAHGSLLLLGYNGLPKPRIRDAVCVTN